jgi:signal transduction histidine kinase/HAMP domain-containing protein
MTRFSRRSLRGRLLLGFSFLFAVPTLALWYFERRDLERLERGSRAALEAAAQDSFRQRVRDDVKFRAEELRRRLRLFEEADRGLAEQATYLFGRPLPAVASGIGVDSHGHRWTVRPDAGSVAYVASSRAPDSEEAEELGVTRALIPAMKTLLERRTEIFSAFVHTSGGVYRQFPWSDIHAGVGRRALSEKFSRDPINRFPRHVAAGIAERPLWTTAYAEQGGMAGWIVTVLVPVRSASGVLQAVAGLDIDARAVVDTVVSTPGSPPAHWAMFDSEGHTVDVPKATAELLGWSPGTGDSIKHAPTVPLVHLGRDLTSNRQFYRRYQFSRPVEAAWQFVPDGNWIFVEFVSPDDLKAARTASGGELLAGGWVAARGNLSLAFALMAVVVLGGVLMFASWVSGPIERLASATDAMGRGHPVPPVHMERDDEIGRLAQSLNGMSQRVERQIATLRGLHELSRVATEMPRYGETLSRVTEIIGRFLEVERCWIYLHDVGGDRLCAAWPAWGLTEEEARNLIVPLASESIAAFVFRTGDYYLANDLDNDPHVLPPIRKMVSAQNALFAPMRTEEGIIGVLVVTNRVAGYGEEEVNALTAFADAASLLIRNARLYEQLDTTVAELRRANRLKDYFLQNVNHELRTPLTSILGWTELFEESAVPAEAIQTGLKQVRQCALTLMALINDLLDLSRLDRGVLALELRPIDLQEVVERAAATVALMAQAKGVILDVEPPLEPMPPVVADGLRIQQVLWNLMSNAIKFTGRGGRIVVSTEQSGDRFIVTVEDNGIGIPERDLPYVFERFRQADGSATRTYSGMGIGLALARSLVELHGGTIQVESKVGRGSRFFFSLPARAREPQGSPIPAG